MPFKNISCCITKSEFSAFTSAASFCHSMGSLHCQITYGVITSVSNQTAKVLSNSRTAVSFYLLPAGQY